ncbi:HD family phosphohydrolase [Pararhodospirillum oryzae]|nr:HD family phosphohydrolase [Pararhodospirillum oryzae]
MRTADRLREVIQGAGAFPVARPLWGDEDETECHPALGAPETVNTPRPPRRPPSPAGRSRDHLRRLIEAGIALSAERDHDVLVERILLEAKSLTNADGGTLYLRTDDMRQLRFVIMRNDSLNVALGGTTGKPIPFPPLNIYLPDEAPNYHNVCTAALLDARTINIADAYEAHDYDFSGTKKFDQTTGYRSKSFLTIPLRNHKDEVIGVLQLINAQDGAGNVIPFTADIQQIIEALASQAAVALDNQVLIAAQRRLLDSLIKLLAGAIDAKSPYTSGHCDRVPQLANMLAAKAVAATDGPFSHFSMNEDERYEFNLAGWLHDCGKITSPEYVVDKATKLETIYNRVHEIRTRFEVLWRDAEIECLKAQMAGGDAAALSAAKETRQARLRDDFAFVARANVGGEFMADGDIERLKAIGATRWTRYFDDRLGLSQGEEERLEGIPRQDPPIEVPLLADRPDHVVPWGNRRPPVEKDDPRNTWGFDMTIPEHAFNFGELYNLTIRRGTLTEEERFKINEHIVQTIIMLSSLPLPRQLGHMPEIAGCHHEKMDGTGYPRRLPGEKLSVSARIMALADIFEALTAADRPYKKAKTLSESVKILSFMVKDRHVDREVFELFLSSGVYREYGEAYLRPDQMDDVDISQYLRPPAPAASAPH